MPSRFFPINYCCACGGPNPDHDYPRSTRFSPYLCRDCNRENRNIAQRVYREKKSGADINGAEAVAQRPKQWAPAVVATQTIASKPTKAKKRIRYHGVYLCGSRPRAWADK